MRYTNTFDFELVNATVYAGDKLHMRKKEENKTKKKKKLEEIFNELLRHRVSINTYTPKTATKY